MVAATQTTANPTLMRAYLDAVYHIGDGDNVHELVIGQHFQPSPSRDRMHALITACNPGSLLLSGGENDARMVQLMRQVEKLGIHWQAANSESPDGDWREPSLWLTDIDVPMLDMLAATFGQNACVVVDAEGRIRLRIYRDDWRTPVPHDQRLQWAATEATA